MMHAMAIRFRAAVVVLMALLGTMSGQTARAQAISTESPDRDFVFFVFSDTHVGAEQLKATPPVTRDQTLQRIQASLDRMRQLPGQPFPRGINPAQAEPGTIAVPRALFILGDLTDGHKDTAQVENQWNVFEGIYPRHGVAFGQQSVPVYAIAGNHDGDPAGPPRRRLAERNRAAGRLAAVSANGAHFAINWEGVHLVFLSLCAADATDAQTPFRFGQPGAGSWNDPQMALTFLRDYLRKHVGQSGAPVILMQHYGFDEFSAGDWYWWTARQRRTLYEVLADYNIAAILHGHNHRAEHYRWPDPSRHAADLATIFGDQVPASYRQYTILSCGGVCWVFRIRGNEMIGAHLRESGWSKRPAPFVLQLEQTLSPRR